VNAILLKTATCFRTRAPGHLLPVLVVGDR
jgi:hypothetical protein